MTIRCSESELISKYERKEVKIRSINKKHKAGSVFREGSINIPFMNESVNIQKNIMMLILVLMPVFVIKKGAGSYAAIGNLRVLKVARAVFKKESDTIKVNVMEDNERIARHMALIEFILMPILFRVNYEGHSLEDIVSETVDKNRQTNIKRFTDNIEKIVQENSTSENINIAEIININTSHHYKVYQTLSYTKNSIRLLLEMCPAIVTEKRNEGYECVANRKIMMVIKEQCGEEELLPVIKINKINNNNMVLCERLSYAFATIVHAIPKGFAPQYGKLIKLMTKEDKAFICKGKLTQESIAGMVNYSKKYLCHMEQKFISIKDIETKKEDLKKYDIDITNSDEE